MNIKKISRQTLKALPIIVSRTLSLMLAVQLVWPSTAYALPRNPEVVYGEAKIGDAGKELTIDQTSDKTIINWGGYSIDAAELVRYLQPGANSISLNRVTGGDPSLILGQLQANGQIFLINPSGVIFGKEAQVNTAGLLATTLDIADPDFIAGKYNFAQDPTKPLASVINKGQIVIANNGYAVLVAPLVSNEGLIVANLGQVKIGGAEAFSVNFDGQGLVNFAISDPTSNEPGTVLVPTEQISDIVKEVVGTPDLYEAGSIVEKGGLTYLAGASGTVINSGTIRADGAAGQAAGTIDIYSTRVAANTAGSTLTASGASEGSTGGTIRVLAKDVVIASGDIDVSGDTGGGTALIGGDFQGKNPDIQNAAKTYVGPKATIKADAIDTGNGGKVIVWANDWTKFHGAISARGGGSSGDGGFTEVSGKDSLVFRGTADLSAPAGTNGTLLLDPTDVNICDDPGDQLGLNDTGDPHIFYDPDDSAADNLLPATLEAELALANVLVTTASGGPSTGTLTVSSAVTWNSGNYLRLRADSDLTLSALITNTAAGDLYLESGGSISSTTGTTVIAMGTGGLSLDADGSIGALGVPILTQGVTDLTASAGSNIYITNGTSGNITTGTLSAGGDIALDNDGGNITIGSAASAGGDILVRVNTESALTVNNSVTSSGGGDINLRSRGDVLVNDDVTTSGTGSVTLAADTVAPAGGDVVIGDSAAASVTGGSGGVTISGASIQVGEDFAGPVSTTGGGSVTMTSNSTIEVNNTVSSSGSGTIYLEADSGDLTINDDITSAGGDIDLRAEDNVYVGADISNSGGAGYIYVQGDSNLDTTGAVSVGHGAAGSITGGSGDVTIEGNSVLVGDDSAGTVSTVTGGDIELYGANYVTVNDTVSASGSGAVSLTTDTGNITINDTVTSGSGNISMYAGDGTVHLNADVTTGGGDLDLEAEGDVNVNSAVSTSGTGTIYIESDADSIAGGDVHIGRTAAGSVTGENGLITLDGGNIYVGNDGFTGYARTTGSGDIELDPDPASASDVVVGADGYLNSAHDITINQSNDVLFTDSLTGIYAGRNFTITPAAAATGDVEIYRNVTADTGNISVTTDGSITVNKAILAATGNISLAADDDDVGGGDVTIGGANNTRLVTGSGNDISLTGNNILVGTGLGTAKLDSGTGNLYFHVLNDGQLRIDEGTSELSMMNFIIDGTDRPGTLIVSDTEGANTISATDLNSATNGYVLLNSGVGGITISDPVNLSTNHSDLMIGTDVTSGGAVNINAATSAENVTIVNTGTTTINNVLLDATDGDIAVTSGTITFQNGGWMRAYHDALASDVTLIANTGGINSGTATYDVVAGTLLADGNTGIGAGAGNPLATDIDQLQARSLTGNIYVSNSGNLEIADLGGSWGSDTIASSSHVKIETAGSMTVSEDVTAGSDDVLLHAVSGSLAVNAAVTAGNDISLLAGTSLSQSAAGDVTAGGTLDVEAQGGDITMTDGAVSQATGNLRYKATGDITLGSVSTAAGAYIDAGESIIDGGNTDVDVVASTAQLVAGDNVGSAGAGAIDTTIGTLAASAAGTILDGNIYLSETDSLVIGSVAAIDVNRVNLDSTTDTEAGSALAGATAANNLKIEADSTITVSEAVDATGGDLLLDAGLHLAVNNTVDAGGDASLLASGNISQGAAGAITTAGETLDVEAGIGGAGSISMTEGAVAQTAGGNIRYKAADNVTLGSLNAGTGSIRVEATGGSIIDGTVAETANITASETQLVAGTSIGQPTGTGNGPIDLAVDTVAAQAGTGNIYLSDPDSLVIGSVDAISVNRIGIDSSSTPFDDGSLAGAVGGTNVKIEVPDDLTVNSPVTTTTGDILLRSTAGNLAINAEVTAGNDASLLAGLGITQAAAGDVITGGTLDVEAAAGDIEMADDAISQATENVRYLATGDITLGSVQTDAGAYINAGGSIIDGGNTDVDVVALTAQLVAGDNVGAPGAGAIDTTIGTLAASAAGTILDGNIYISDTDSPTIGSVAAIEVNRIGIDSSTTPTADGILLEGATAANNLKIEAANALTVNEAVEATAGDLLLHAIAGSLAVNNTVEATAGDASLLANTGITQSAAGDVVAGGTLDAYTVSGGITMADGAVSTSTGNLRYLADTGDISLGTLSAPAADIRVEAAGGSIINNCATAVNVESVNAQLVASDSIGQAAGTANGPIKTTIGTVAASAGSGDPTGDIYLSESDDLVIGSVAAIDVNRIGIDSSTTPIPGSLLEGATAADNLKIEAADSLTVDGFMEATAGDLLLHAIGGDLNINNFILASEGNISIRAGLGITQSGDGDVLTANGTLDAEAEGGDITMADGAESVTFAGNIRYLASGDVNLGTLCASDNVRVEATGGSIINNCADATNIVATGAQLKASGSIGQREGEDFGPIEAGVVTVAAEATTGNIYLSEGDELIIGTVGDFTVGRIGIDSSTTDQTCASMSGATAADNLKIQTAINLTVDEAVLATAGDLLLHAQGGDLAINNTVDAGDDASLLASAGITQAATGDVTVGGTLDVEAQGGSITMADGAVSQATGNMRYLATGDVTLGSLVAPNVRVEATGGAIIDGGETNVDVVATTAQLVAGTSIGQPDGTANGPIDTTVGTLAAEAGSGVADNIYLSDTASTIIGNVAAIDINRIGIDSSTTPIVGSSLAGATAGNNVKIEAAANLTVDEAVEATAGDLLLHAQGGDLAINNTVDAGDDASLLASAGITQAATGDVTVGGTLDVEAQGGSITMADGAVSQATGNMRYLASEDVTLGSLVAPNVRIEATGGSIIDGGNTDVDVVATTAQLVAADSIGQRAGEDFGPINTTVTTIATEAGTGNTYISETDSLIIGSVAAIDVNRIGIDSSTTPIAGSVLTGATADDYLKIEAADDLTVNEPALARNDDLLLHAIAGDLAINNTVTATAGNASLLAGLGITQAAAGDVVAGGTLDAEAQDGSITMADGAVSTSTGNMRYLASDDVTIGSLVAPNVRVEATGGSIIDGGETDVDIIATNTQLAAGVSIGQREGEDFGPIDTTVDTLAANAATGNIYLSESDSLIIGRVEPIDVERVNMDSTTTTQPGVLLIGAAAANNLKIRAQDDLTVDSVADNEVTATAGDLLLLALTGDLAINNPVTAVAGNASILAGLNITQSAAGDVTAGGTLDAEAHGGSITMADGAVSTSTGNMRYLASDNIYLGSLVAPNVRVEAIDGSIIDNGETDVDIIATNAQLVAGVSIGQREGEDLGPIDTTIDTLASSAGTGNTYISETDSLIIGEVEAFTVGRIGMDSTNYPQTCTLLAGAIAADNLKIEAADNITVDEPATATAGDLLLHARRGDLAVNAAVTSGRHASLLAGRDITQSADGDVTAGGTLDVHAQGGSITMADGAVSTSTGNMRYLAARSITLGGLYAPAVRVEAVNGSIYDGGDRDLEVTARYAQLVASGSIGQRLGEGRGPLDVRIDNLAASAGDNIYLSDVHSTIIGSISPINVNRVNMNSTISNQPGSLLEGAIGGNNVKIEAADNLTANNAVTARAGDLLLHAIRGDLAVNAPVTAGDAASLLAGRGITQSAAGDVVAGSTLDVNAQGGSITMADGAVSTSTGNMRYLASGDVTIGGLIAPNIRVEATGGSIYDGGDSDVDVSATTAQLVAGDSIGQPAGTGNGAIDTALDTVAASATNGNIYLSDISSLTIGEVSAIDVGRINMDSTTTNHPGTVLAGAAGDDNVAIEAAGGLTVNNPVTATLGALLLNAKNGDLAVNAAVVAGSNASLLASRGITQAAAGDITAGGTLDVNAQDGSITMADGAVSHSTGNLRYLATGDIILSSVQTDSGARIEAGGSIIDGGDSDVDVVADRAQLVAGASIGQKAGEGLGPLYTTIGTLAADAGTGNIYLSDSASPTIGEVGAIDVERVNMDGTTTRQAGTALAGAAAAGNLKIQAADNLGVSAPVTARAGDLLLHAISGDLAIGAAVNSSRHASLLAGKGITQSAAGDVTVGGTLDVEAQGGSITMADGAVSTSIGNMRYLATGDITLGSLSAHALRVEAGGSIKAASDTGVNITAGVAQLVAGGSIGSRAGTGAGPIKTRLGVLAAKAGRNIYIKDNGYLMIGYVDPISLNRVNIDSTLTNIPGSMLVGIEAPGEVIIDKCYFGNRWLRVAMVGLVPDLWTTILQENLDDTWTQDGTDRSKWKMTQELKESLSLLSQD